MTIATVNVSTLFPKELRAKTGARSIDQLTRVALLEKQFVKAEIDIAGLQETRLQREGSMNASEYTIVSAPASKKGVGGCQIWIRSGLCEGRPRVVEASEQVLAIIIVDKEGRHTGAVSAHAPYEAALPEAKDTFWDRLD